jgi:hypothetical protein
MEINMGDRYYITGVQLGLLKIFMEQGNLAEMIKLWNEIYKNQYMGEKK